MRMSVLAALLSMSTTMFPLGPPCLAEGSSRYFVIIVVDGETGRGVPLVELQTTNAISYFTDSRGMIAFDQPGLMNQRVFFTVSSHGYEFPGKVFETRGVTLKTVPGDSVLLRVRRTKIAERLYRTTGQGTYDQSVRAGYQSPVKQPLLNGRVMGQDGGVGVVYRRRIHWFWGDTGCPFGPLGNFGSSGATSELPGNGGLDPSVGIDYTYFVDSSGFSRPMVDVPGPGMKWLGMLMVVPDTLVHLGGKISWKREDLYER